MQLDRRLFGVGLTILAALAVLATGILLVGERQFLFTTSNRYFVRLKNVNGLANGNPVQLNGVNVGKVERIVLPQAMEEEFLEVWITIDRRYEGRVRGDSLAGIKTLGLLGDKYVAVTSGSPGSPVILPEQEIPAAPATDVDQLLASGEDVVQNILSVAHSLANILGRMERGEGLLGGLLSGEGRAEELAASLAETLASIEATTKSLEQGKGPLGRLLHDEEMGDRMDRSLVRLEGLLTQVEEGDGLLPALLSDATLRDRFETSLHELSSGLADLADLTSTLQEGDGLVPRLLNDPEYGEQITRDLQELLSRLNVATEKLTAGDGTVAQLVNDPEIYQALNDIVVGINESRLLRWLIRNRQKAGIKKRYKEEVKKSQEGALPQEPATVDDEP